MYDPVRIGANIRSLRIAYGESQEALGKVIGVGKSAINMYEAGEREPSKGNLSNIARHYLVSVDELIYSDFSGMNKITSLDIYIILDNIDVLLPIISTEEAQQSQHFRKAVNRHRDIYEQLRKHILDGIDGAFISVRDYIKAYREEQVGPVAIANILALEYFLMYLLKSAKVITDDQPYKPAPLGILAKKSRAVKDFMDHPDLKFNESVTNADERLKESGFDGFLTELKSLLKQSPRYSDLCDYYLALQYCWNFVDNDLTPSFNLRIGLEMLIAFGSVGNNYAADFLDIFQDEG